MEEGRNFVVCNAGDEEFKQAIPENAYRSQVCQHAAALSLSYVLIVYCTPGTLPKKRILVHISVAQRKALSTLQEVLANQFMSFTYNEENFMGVFPDLGEDYSPAYGYAQEHHTVEIWLHYYILCVLRPQPKPYLSHRVLHT